MQNTREAFPALRTGFPVITVLSWSRRRRGTPRRPGGDSAPASGMLSRPTTILHYLHPSEIQLLLQPVLFTLFQSDLYFFIFFRSGSHSSVDVPVGGRKSSVPLTGCGTRPAPCWGGAGAGTIPAVPPLTLPSSYVPFSLLRKNDVSAFETCQIPAGQIFISDGSHEPFWLACSDT